MLSNPIFVYYWHSISLKPYICILLTYYSAFIKHIVVYYWETILLSTPLFVYYWEFILLSSPIFVYDWQTISVSNPIFVYCLQASYIALKLYIRLLTYFIALKPHIFFTTYICLPIFVYSWQGSVCFLLHNFWGFFFFPPPLAKEKLGLRQLPMWAGTGGRRTVGNPGPAGDQREGSRPRWTH